MITIKRAYEPAAADDGYRVLIDRLWPRGIRKGALPLDAWVRDLAPSAALRKWFGHDPKRWVEFARRYREELRAGAAWGIVLELARRSATGKVTLVFGARDPQHNNAVVLKQEIERELGAGAHPQPR